MKKLSVYMLVFSFFTMLIFTNSWAQKMHCAVLESIEKKLDKIDKNF